MNEYEECLQSQESSHTGRLSMEKYKESSLALSRPRRARKPSLKMRDLALDRPTKVRGDSKNTRSALQNRLPTTDSQILGICSAGETSPVPLKPTCKIDEATSPNPTIDKNSLTPALSPFKQNNTILHVLAITGIFSTSVPVKMRSCMTKESFFATVLAAAGGTNNQEDMKADIMVNLDWKKQGDRFHCFTVKQNGPDAFEILVETIDNAPCWNSWQRRCNIDVYVCWHKDQGSDDLAS